MKFSEQQILILIALWAFCFQLNVGSVRSQCLSDQLSLLLQFRQNLTDPAFFFKLDSWNSSTDCCSWGGVTCSSNGHVIGLNLSSSSTDDESDSSSIVPEVLGNLSYLTSLDLSSCGLYGKFPEKIFLLPHLQYLDISHNPDLQGLIPEFPANGSLQTMLLSFTSFGGNLPDSIGNLERLSRIELFGCNFSGPIPDSMAKLAHLVSLDFSDNNFSGPIPSFSSAKNLSRLELYDNCLSGTILSTNWSGLSKLEYIDMSNNSLSGAIPESLFGIPSLGWLYLQQNQFTRILDGALGLASSALKMLDLSDNELAGPFPVFISRLRSLDSLWLSSSKFRGSVNLRFFQQMRNLSVLDLSYNSLWINDTGIDPASLPQIYILNLASCQLTGFPTFLKEQALLGDLDISNNQIGGDIPDWIWKLIRLSDLNLSYNSLENFEEPFKGFQSSLSSLDLSGNKLQGRLPMLPPSAEHVDYSSNNFNSVIPDNVGEFLGSTNFFSLANNNLHGSIPQSICNTTSLNVLNLSNNSLSGTIPQCLIGMAEYLQVLNLRRNNLSGNIPDAFGFCWLQTLDLSGNQLHGEIPRSMANCTDLEVLDLGHNQFNDIFPCHLRTLSTLRVLVLRSNHLQGSIGCSNANFSWQMLQIVDLSSNNFSGILPIHNLRTWKAMTHDKDEVQQIHFLNADRDLYYQDSTTITTKGSERQLVKILTIFTSIDFSCNNFEGKIPSLMGEFRALYFLNLSHNSFSSVIPSSLGDLGHLESLDLSSNYLSGEIPQQLADLNFLEVLNLSHNQLEGRIPSGRQFQTFSEDSFKDNKALCGVPLKESCSPNAPSPPPPRALEDKKHSDDGVHVSWEFLSVEIGFVFGLAIVILPLMFWRRWRIWYCRQLDVLLSRFFPQWNQRSQNLGNRISRRTRTRTQLSERNTIAGEVALQPQVSKHRKGRRTGVIVV